MRRHPSSTTSATPPNSAAISAAAPPKKRGSYNCGRCGLPKKGHVCTSEADPPRSDNHRLRRALSFDDYMVGNEEEVDFQPLSIEPPPVVEVEEDEEVEVAGSFLPLSCLVELLRRLPPRELMAAARVSKGWRECVRRVWRSAEELRLRVPPRSQIGLVGSVLQKCAGLIRLSLRMERLELLKGGFHDGRLCNELDNLTNGNKIITFKNSDL